MTVIYFFFGHLRVFWVTLELLAINVEKSLQWRLRTRLFFCLHWKKKFLSLMRSYYWDNFRFNQMLIIIKLELQIQATYRNFLTEQKALSILYFLFVLVNWTVCKKLCAELNLSSISNQLIQFFTLFSRCFQYMTKQM